MLQAGLKIVANQVIKITKTSKIKDMNIIYKTEEVFRSSIEEKRRSTTFN